MKPTTRRPRRPSVQITDARASRLHRLVLTLRDRPRLREELLAELGIGLRTFYRELELLKRCGVKVRLLKKQYVLHSTVEAAEALLPFPDPRLSFAEMAELVQGTGAAALRLAELYERVTTHSPAKPANARSGKTPGRSRKKAGKEP